MRDEIARLVLTDEPDNVRVAGHVTGGLHREFLMASGEMSDAEFESFNKAWIEASLAHLCDGGGVWHLHGLARQSDRRLGEPSARPHADLNEFR
jgi:hypothetical protein